MKRISIVAGVALALSAVPALAQMQYQAPTPAQPRQIEAPKDAQKSEGSTAMPALPTVETPKHKCEAPPAYPGRVGMQTEDRRNRFQRQLEDFRKCMTGFIAERQAWIKANTDAANATIAEYNAQMKRLTDEQAAARD